MVSLQQPNEGFVKLNVDGSFLGNSGRICFGGLIRNNNGDWLIGFSCYTVGSNLFLEPLVIKFGLQFV
jgi:hypothetical protein